MVDRSTGALADVFEVEVIGKSHRNAASFSYLISFPPLSIMVSSTKVELLAAPLPDERMSPPAS
jgi:hypothetical protein